MKTNKLVELFVMARKNSEGVKFLFTTETSMEAKTIHRAVRRRWKLERAFLDWKQRAGMENIHFQDQESSELKKLISSRASLRFC